MKNPLRMIPHWYLIVLPIFFLFFGSFLNVFVMAINHNQMPVLMPGASALVPGSCDPAEFVGDIQHSCMTVSTHIKFLADWIFIKSGVASVGDMFIYLGEFLFLPALYIWIAFVIKDHNSTDEKLYK